MRQCLPSTGTNPAALRITLLAEIPVLPTVWHLEQDSPPVPDAGLGQHHARPPRPIGAPDFSLAAKRLMPLAVYQHPGR